MDKGNTRGQMTKTDQRIMYKNLWIQRQLDIATKKGGTIEQSGIKKQ